MIVNLLKIGQNEKNFNLNFKTKKNHFLNLKKLNKKSKVTINFIYQIVQLYKILLKMRQIVLKKSAN